MIEKVITFGASKSLVGILTDPSPGAQVNGAPGVLFWNVGIHHRVGPSRIFASLSRRLAEVGYTAFRFDVSGLGDSEISRDDHRSDHDRAIGDVREAMQVLRKQRGIDRFVLVGFCSGVDAAHALAVAEPSIVGLVYLEGYTYVTAGYRAFYLLRYLDRDRWERWFQTRLSRLLGGVPGGAAARRVFVREYPTRQKFRSDVRSMLEAGKRLLFIYVGGDSGYAHRNQLYEVLGSPSALPGLELEFLRHADHTFSFQADRQEVIQSVVSWMRSQFRGTGVISPQVSTNGISGVHHRDPAANHPAAAMAAEPTRGSHGST